MLPLGEVAERVLGDDHRPVDDEPEIERPELIRFAEILASTIPLMVISIATGMTSAVMTAARMLPSSRNR